MRNTYNRLHNRGDLMHNNSAVHNKKSGATRPMFAFRVLMEKCGAPTAEVMAQRCGLNRKGVHNRIIRGIGWAEADELAIRCGFFPWEVWPEWELVDPADWLEPVCKIHGNDFAEDLPDLSQQCGACKSASLHHLAA